MLENPLADDHISSRRPRNKTPSTIVNQRLKLICHGYSPIRIHMSTAKIGRNGRSNNMISRQILVTDWLNCTRMESSNAAKSRRWRRTTHRTSRGLKSWKHSRWSV